MAEAETTDVPYARAQERRQLQEPFKGEAAVSVKEAWRRRAFTRTHLNQRKESRREQSQVGRVSGQQEEQAVQEVEQAVGGQQLARQRCLNPPVLMVRWKDSLH